MANKVANFQALFDGKSQTVPAVNDKGTVTITMPATAEAGEQYVLEALAKDGDNRTIGRASKTITAVNPAILRPKINIPRNSTYVINDNIPVELAPVEYTPGYAGTHVSTTYQVAADSAFTDLLCEITSTSDLTSAVLKLSRPLAQKEGAFIRVKITEDTLGESEWSEIHSVAGTQPEAPAIIRPKAASLVSYRAVPVETEPMSCLGKAADTHISTDWKLTDVTGSLVYAENMGDTVNLTAYTFNKDIPKNTYAYLHVRHHGLISGVGVWATRPIQISEEEIPVAPTITFPREYCHPKNISILLSKLVVLNMAEYRCIGAQYKIALDTEGENILYDSGQVDNCERHDLSLSTPLEPGAKVYFFARQREETVGWTPWCAPVGMLAAKTATPSFLFPKDGGQVYETIFTASISEFRTQGLTSDTHISTDWEITTDDGETELFRSTGDMVNLITIPIALSEDLMGSHIRMRVRVTGEYTGPSAWVTARVLLHLPMHVFAPTITVPAAGAYIGMREVAVQTSPFLTENVDVPKHAATLVRVTYDEEGLKTAFLSSEITLGDKTKYTINFGAPPTAAVLYISARHKDDFAGWSEWGVPQRVALAAPVAPTIIAPVSTDLIGFADITVRLSGYALEGGITGMPHKDTHIVVKDRDTGEVYIDMLAGGPLLTIPLEGTQSMVNKWVTLEASFIGENAGEGKTASVTFKIRRISQGVRIGGGATVIGMPDGSPFNIKGRELFVAVADSAFRVAGGTEYGPKTDTLLDNAPYIPGVLPTLTAGATEYPSIAGVAEGTLDRAVPSEARDSRHNTHVLTELNPGQAAEGCSGVVIGSLSFELPNIDVLMRVIQRGEYIDAHEEQTGLHTFASEMGGYLWSSTENAAEAAYSGFTYAPGIMYPNKDGVIALSTEKPGYCPVFELPCEGLEDENVTMFSPEIIVFGTPSTKKDIPVSIRVNVTPADTPLGTVEVTVDGEKQTLPVRNGYAKFSLMRAEPGSVTITAEATAMDGTKSPIAELVVNMLSLQPEKPSIVLANRYILANGIAVGTSEFKLPAEAVGTHVGSQYQLCGDAAGASVVFDSGQVPMLTSYTFLLPEHLAPRQTVFIRARHVDSLDRWSEWSTAAQAVVTYPVAPVVNAPLDGSNVNVNGFQISATDSGMMGGLSVSESQAEGKARYEVELASADGSTTHAENVYDIITAGTYHFYASDIEKDKNYKLRIRKTYGLYGPSEWIELTIYAINTRIGERICDKATVIGMADGSPFEDYNGAKYYIAVADEEYWTPEVSSSYSEYRAQGPLITPLTAVPDAVTTRHPPIEGDSIPMLTWLNEIQKTICGIASREEYKDETTVLATYKLKALCHGIRDKDTLYTSDVSAQPVEKLAELNCGGYEFSLPCYADCLRIAASWHVYELCSGSVNDIPESGFSSPAIAGSTRCKSDSHTPGDRALQKPDVVGKRAAPFGVIYTPYVTTGAQVSSGRIGLDNKCATSIGSGNNRSFVPVVIIPYDEASAKLLDVNMVKTYGANTAGGKNVIQQWLPPRVGSTKRAAYPRSLIELTAGDKPVDDRMYMVSPGIFASGVWGDASYCAIDPLPLYYKDKVFWIINGAHRRRIETLFGGSYEKYVADLTFGEFSAEMNLTDAGALSAKKWGLTVPERSVQLQHTVRVTTMLWSKLYYSFLDSRPPAMPPGAHQKAEAHYRVYLSRHSLPLVYTKGQSAGQIAGNAGWHTTAPIGNAGVVFDKSFGTRSGFAAEDKLEIYRQAITRQGAAWCGQPAIHTGDSNSQDRRTQRTLSLLFTKSAAYYTDLVGVPPGIATLGFRYDPDDPGGEIPDSEYNY